VESTGVDSTPAGGNGNPAPTKPGRLQFSAPSVSVGEAGGNATITITRTEGSEGAASVRVTSRDGSATQPQDYTSVSTTVSFAAGDATPKTVTVPIINDPADEPDETLYLTLSSATGASLGSTSEVLMTINDDDVSPPAAPKAALSAVYKNLHIDWTAASGATSYRLLKDPTGSAGFMLVGADLPASDRSIDIDVVVHKEDWQNARYAIAACNSAGCTQSNALSADGLSAALIGYLKAPQQSTEYDSFGTAVALSADGNTLAVGTPQGDDTGLARTGIVHIYARSGASWTLAATLHAANGEVGDFFGSTLALSADGNTLVVGAPYEDSNGADPANNGAQNAGAAYVFARSGGNWSQSGYLKSPAAAEYDSFGSYALAISSDGATIAVGNPYKSTYVPSPGTNIYSHGAVYIYTKSGTSWSPGSPLLAPTPTQYANFGQAVALSNGGETLAIGAPGEIENAIDGAGAVYLYDRSGNTWSYVNRFAAPVPQFYASFGSTLATNPAATLLAVGAPSEDADGPTPADPLVYNAGAVYVYDLTVTAPNPLAHLRASNVGEYDYFGSVLAMSGDGSTLVASSIDEDGGVGGINGAVNEAQPSSGAAYVFIHSGSTWSQRSYVKASNPGRDDDFGTSLALDARGNTLIVSAPYESSAAMGLNGNQRSDCSAATPTNCVYGAGAVYIY
ncbi:MAG TPA: Calx-beta domain-containing protein, partial [Povalibacter sp.]|nr:Calx-beta domain-containing protein [Povalibacter sp.]